MRIISLIFFILFLSGCAGYVEIEQHRDSFIRRMPQINRIETGRPMSQGSFAGAAQVAYALTTPQILHYTDTSLSIEKGLFGTQAAVLTASNTYFFESRYMASGEGVYAFTDVLSLGLSLDGSFGELEGTTAQQGSTIKQQALEGTVFIKFAKQFGRAAVCLKPEVSLAHIYGDRFWNPTDSTSSIRLVSEQIEFYTFSIRSNSVLRYDVLPGVTPFIAIEIKTQPYPLASDKLAHEVAYGLYGGLDLFFCPITVSPFIALPLGASHSNFSSPVSAGIHCSFILEPNSY